MPRMRDDSRNGERMVALFLLGMVLFNPLVVGILDIGADGRLFGIPALYLYLFTGWALLIGLIAAVAESEPKDTFRTPGSTLPTADSD